MCVPSFLSSSSCLSLLKKRREPNTRKVRHVHKFTMRRDDVEYFYLSLLHLRCVHMYARARGCPNESIRINARSKRGKLSTFTNEECVNSCVVVSSLSLPFSFPLVILLFSFLSSFVPVLDLNIKGGLNLTYTTLNHVTSIGL